MRLIGVSDIQALKALRFEAASVNHKDTKGHPVNRCCAVNDNLFFKKLKKILALCMPKSFSIVTHFL